MDSNNINSGDEQKQKFIAGQLSDEEDYLFRMRMEEDDALREEVEMLMVLKQAEIQKYADSLEAEDPIQIEPAKAPKIIPMYRQPWFRIAASVLLVLGIGVGVWYKVGMNPEVAFMKIPVKIAESSSLGFGPGEEDGGAYVGKIITDEDGALRYQISGDTLEILTPHSPDKQLKPQIINDPFNNRLILIWEGKHYLLDPQKAKNIVPLQETEY